MPEPTTRPFIEGGEDQKVQEKLLQQLFQQLLIGAGTNPQHNISPISQSFGKVFKSFSRHATPMRSSDPKDPDMGMLYVKETGATIDKHSYLVHRLQVTLLEQLYEELEALYKQGKLHQEGKSPRELLIEYANRFMNSDASQKAVEGYLTKNFSHMNLSPTVTARLAHNVHMGLVPVVAEALNYAVGKDYIAAISPNLKAEGEYFELTEKKKAQLLEPQMLTQKDALDSEYTHVVIYPDVPGEHKAIPMIVRLPEPVRPKDRIAKIRAEVKTGIIHGITTVSGKVIYPDQFMPHIGKTPEGAGIIDDELAPYFESSPAIDLFSKTPTSMSSGSKASVKVDGVANDIPQSKLTTSRAVGEQASFAHNSAFSGALLYRVLAGDPQVFSVRDLGRMASHSYLAVNHGRDALQDICDKMADAILETDLDGGNIKHVRAAFIAAISPMLDGIQQLGQAQNNHQRDLATHNILELTQSTAEGKLLDSEEGRRLVQLLAIDGNRRTFIETGWEPLLTVFPEMVEGDAKTLETAGTTQWSAQFKDKKPTNWREFIQGQQQEKKVSWADAIVGATQFGHGMAA